MKSKPSKFIVPANGLRIICPELGSALPKTGDTRELSPYWHKRQQAGDVVFYESEEDFKTAPETDESDSADA